jgi:cytochrome c biogenesis protein CcmG, thiol:disulfide interchange protein DsbE
MMRGVPLLIAALALAPACAEIDTRQGQVGERAPEYAAVTLEGDSVFLADLEGSVVLLNVWATWCAPCREEIPALQELHERHHAEGLRVVGVSVDGRREGDNVRRFADSFGVTYAIWHDPDDRVGSRFRSIGVPTTVLIDRGGTIVWRHLGAVTADDPGLNRHLGETLGAAG